MTAYVRPLLAPVRSRPPRITMMLMASVLVTTVPQFVLPPIYGTLTGTLFGFEVPHYLTLPLFAHSPAILLPHVLGNLSVLLLFGGLSEVVLGSRRFAILTLAAAAVSLSFSYLRGLSSVHGVSGIAWAFHVPALLALLAAGEHAGGRRLLRDPLVWVYGGFYLFDFVGLPLLEVVVLGRRFFDNFGQVQHLAAVVTAVPFTLVWRRSIEHGGRMVAGTAAGPPGAPAGDTAEAPGAPAGHTGGKPGAPEPRTGRLPQAVLGALLLLNLAGTVDAVVVSVQDAGGAGYTVEPPAETAVAELGRRVEVSFSDPILQGQVNVRRRSIWYDNAPPPSVEVTTAGPRTVDMTFSRRLREGEAVLLAFDVYRRGPRGVPVPISVEISYGNPP